MRYLLLFTFLPILGLAQPCRFLSQVFPTISKTSDVVYANAPAIPAVYVSENVTTNQDQTMDIWFPVGDTMAKRPVILFAHGGGFISGSKDNDDMQYLADTFAHYGYVTASMNYRINLNAASTSSVDRAIWRATQDGSAAIRYLKENANTYGIDTNHIFMWGSSAGTFLSLSLMYCSDQERPSSANSGFLQPDLGCKDCVGNNYHHRGRPDALVGCWGAIADTSWISPAEYKPTIMFHGDIDPVVPYSEGYPFSALFTAPWVFGSQRMDQRLNHLNLNHEFYIGTNQLHEYWGVVNGIFPPGPVTDPDYPDIIQKSALFLYQVLGEPGCSAVGINISEQEKCYAFYSEGEIHINCPKNQILKLYNLDGKLIQSFQLNKGLNSQKTQLPSGLYILRGDFELIKLNIQD
ncbi:MAG: carboxylesterase family protein [Bacteroidia bacterium]|nr:carboxylesterase family protein [Bacteroidia bacterium]